MSIILEILEKIKTNDVELVLNKEFIVGRSRKCDINVDDDICSANHCSITLTKNSILVKDLGSTNGTFINNRMIETSNLYIGDILKLGNTLISIKTKTLTKSEYSFLDKNEPTKVKVIDLHDGIMQKTASRLNPGVKQILKTKTKKK